MISDPYLEFKREEMILRDWLALDRTVLANKRTFLAYGRTSVALIGLGIAFVKLIHHPFFEVSGYTLMGLGVLVFFVGLHEFIKNTLRFNKLIEKEKDMQRKLEAALSAAERRADSGVGNN